MGVLETARTIHMKRVMLGLRRFTTEEVSKAAQVKERPVRDFINAKAKNGLFVEVERAGGSDGRGRPRKRWRLTEEGVDALAGELRKIEESLEPQTDQTLHRAFYDEDEGERRRAAISDAIAMLENERAYLDELEARSEYDPEAEAELRSRRTEARRQVKQLRSAATMLPRFGMTLADDLKQRLSPGQLLDEGPRYFRDGEGGQYVSTFGHDADWSQRESSAERARAAAERLKRNADETEEGFEHRRQQAMAMILDVKEQAGETADALKKRVGAAMDEASARVEEMKESIRRRSHDMRDSAAHGMAQARDAVSDSWSSAGRVDESAGKNREKTLQDLFQHMLMDVYYAEQKILKSLPKMAKKASSKDLVQAFEHHREETEKQLERLKEVFAIVGEKPKAETCLALDGLLEEAEEIMKEAKTDAVMDAGLLAAAQAVEHYEIARYGTLVAWAEEIGLKDAAKLLQATLDEEYAANDKLDRLAAKKIKRAAAA